MIVIDTNVLSELMRPEPSPTVRAWILRAGSDMLRITAVTRAEILAGIFILPSGRRRDLLDAAARRTFANGFEGNGLPFDDAAPDHYGRIVTRLRQAGRPASVPDRMIAAIARAHGAAVATRNVHEFEECGIVVLDPWTG